MKTEGYLEARRKAEVLAKKLKLHIEGASGRELQEALAILDKDARRYLER
jgi:hypothetical protein